MPQEYTEQGIPVPTSYDPSGYPEGSVASKANSRVQAAKSAPPQSGPGGIMSYLGDLWDGAKGLLPHPPHNVDQLRKESEQQSIAGGDAIDKASNSWVPTTKLLRYTQATGLPMVSGLAGGIADLQGPADALLNGRVPNGNEFHPATQALPAAVLALLTQRTAQKPTYTGKVFNQEGEQFGSMPRNPEIANQPSRVGPAINTAIRGFNPLGIPIGKTMDTLFPQRPTSPVVPERFGGPSTPVPAVVEPPINKPAPNNPLPSNALFAGQPSSPPIPVNQSALDMVGTPPQAVNAAALTQNTALTVPSSDIGAGVTAPTQGPPVSSPSAQFQPQANFQIQQTTQPPTVGFTPPVMDDLMSQLASRAHPANLGQDPNWLPSTPDWLPSTAEEITAVGPEKMRQLMAGFRNEAINKGPKAPKNSKE